MARSAGRPIPAMDSVDKAKATAMTTVLDNGLFIYVVPLAVLVPDVLTHQRKVQYLPKLPKYPNPAFSPCVRRRQARDKVETLWPAEQLCTSTVVLGASKWLGQPGDARRLERRQA